MILSTLASGGIETTVLIVSWLLLIVVVVTGICLVNSWAKRRRQSELALEQLTDDVRGLQESVAELKIIRD